MKQLIAYYSRANENYTTEGIINISKGNTEIAAEHIQKYTGADIFKIEQENEYSADYKTCTEQAKYDLDNNIRPELKNKLDSLSKYDEIILCYPNFWGTMPMAVFTFLEMYDFSNKIIKPLCTHEGSGFGKSLDDIKSTCPNAIIKTGLALQGSKVSNFPDKINVWLDKE